MKTCPVCDTPFPDALHSCPTDGARLISSDERAPGHVVRGKYRIDRKLGQGGMGEVYLATHLMLGGNLALKFLAAELSRNPQFIKRFRQEARAAYQLRHPNIVEVVDLDQDEDGSLFIAMEYVAGPSLRTALRQAGGALSTGRALAIARGLGSGLAAAHARGAVHRDVKPDNILLGLGPEGEERAKILDFGIAAMTESVTELSRTHGLLLTPQYAAPEQWLGTPAAELDGRTDLYALGGVLFEMLTGHTPFLAENSQGWMFQHLQGTPALLEDLRPDLATDYPKLPQLLGRLLARERENRPASAAEFLRELAEVETPPAPVAAPTMAERTPTVVETFPIPSPAASQCEPIVVETVPLHQGDASQGDPLSTGNRNIPEVITLLNGSASNVSRLAIILALVVTSAGFVLWLFSRAPTSSDTSRQLAQEQSSVQQNQVANPAMQEGSRGNQRKPDEAQQRRETQPAAQQRSGGSEQMPAENKQNQISLPAVERTNTPSPDKASVISASDRVWTDPSTGLMWTTRDNGDGNDLTWGQAIEYCRALKTNGLSGWRLPNYDELATLFDAPVLKRFGGPLEISGLEWSSSPGALHEGEWERKWLFFGAGSLQLAIGISPVEDSTNKRALCVRTPN